MRRLAAGLLLMGCAANPVAVAPMPTRVILYQDTVTLEMSDGKLCVGARRGGVNRWSGILGGCPYPMPFQVTRATAKARQVLVQGDHPGAEMRVVIDRDGSPIVFSR